METVNHLIDGEPFIDQSRSQAVYDPATGEAIRAVALASEETVAKAIASAKKAFLAWRNTPAAKRAAIMFRYKQLLEDNAERLCAAITQEHGKVPSDAMGELTRAIEVVDYACGAPELLKGEHSKNVGPGIDSWSEFQALGVVAGITPFNFPAMVPMWMFPMAIVAGNCFVLKPSERDPSATMLAAELLNEAGLPPGVLNVVNGDKVAVDALLHTPDVQAISFVGSTPIAEYVYTTATANGKRVQALGGAKNHAVVMPDANIEQAVTALMGAAYGSSGERCMAVPVVVCVGDQVADAVVAEFKTQVKALKVGPGQSPDSDIGPLISAPHRDKVRGYVDSGVEQGAELVVDGRELEVAGCESGYFLGPCLFDRVEAHMDIYKDEIFGPVLTLLRVASLDEAMALIDAHEYGNGTCIFTRDGEAARYFSDHINIGMVGINVPLPVPVAYHSFGGWKRSLFGDLSIYGPDAIRFYTRRKTITQRWPGSALRESAQYAFPSNNTPS